MQFGAQLGVAVGVRVGRGVDVMLTGVEVAVGVPATLLVKMTSVTPVTILTIATPVDVSWLTVREEGFTSIFET